MGLISNQMQDLSSGLAKKQEFEGEHIVNAVIKKSKIKSRNRETSEQVFALLAAHEYFHDGF